MLNFYKRLFSRAGVKQSPAGDSSLPSSRTHHQRVLKDGSQAATRGQLVHVVMRDLVRKSGIPPGWIQCQIQVVSSRKRGQGIFVRLLVKQWDERLMTYAFAFQKALTTEIVQFDPKADAWLQGIAWQLEVADTCPVTDLPSSQYWKTRGEADPFDIIAIPASAMPVHAPVPDLMAASQSVAVVTPLTRAVPDEPATPENDTAEDLQRLFAIRDRELKQRTVNKPLPQENEKTEPSPL
ncbi:MAG: hypothetical protein ACK5A0_05265 [Polaromonas sp.]